MVICWLTLRFTHALLVFALAWRIDQHRILFAHRAATATSLRLVVVPRRRRLFVIKLLDELTLNLATALLPPLLLGCCLSFNLGEALPELGVAGDFVGGLENGRAPVWSESVGLYSRREVVSKAFRKTKQNITVV